ncbi:DUF805 domain-containing protein [Methanimicrococcus blatticola]|nr:DUF805 domain-containing protein [Methanimicrococcus blatticola]
MQEYFTYEGRLNRLPYFLRILGFWAVMILLLVIAVVAEMMSEYLGMLFFFILAIAYFVGLIFLLFQAIKRLHDLDKSGWYLLIRLAGIIPLIGWIISLGFELYLLLAEGTHGQNRFGPDPLGRNEYNDNNEYQDQYNRTYEAIDAEYETVETEYETVNTYEETDETVYETRE